MDVVRTVLAVVAAILLIVALSSIEAGGGEPATLQETLAFIALGGAALGAIVSQTLEDFEWFHNLSSAVKELIVKGVTIGLPAAALALQSLLPSQLPPPFDQVWVMAVLAVVMFLGSQAWHVTVNKARAS